MKKSTIEQARQLLAHGHRMRNYMLGVEKAGGIWCDLPKEPTVSQIRVLLALNLLGDCPLKVLAERLGISGPAASEMIDRLLEMDLVVREQNPEDRRQIIIRLTSDAQRRVEAHEAQTVDRIGLIMEGLPQGIINQWIQISEIVAGRIDDIEKRSGKKPTRGAN